MRILKANKVRPSKKRRKSRTRCWTKQGCMIYNSPRSIFPRWTSFCKPWGMSQWRILASFSFMRQLLEWSLFLGVLVGVVEDESLSFLLPLGGHVTSPWWALWAIQGVLGHNFLELQWRLLTAKHLVVNVPRPFFQNFCKHPHDRYSVYLPCQTRFQVILSPWSKGAGCCSCSSSVWLLLVILCSFKRPVILLCLVRCSFGWPCYLF